MNSKTLNGKDLQADGSTTIVCLCGSSSQKADFEAAEYREVLAGKIVLTLNIFSSSDEIDLSDLELELITDLHFDKIKMAHEILVILKPDPTGRLKYDKRVGASTCIEIGYALGKDKIVNYFDASACSNCAVVSTDEIRCDDKYRRVLKL
ncbi:MAG: hypothetical protein JZU65_12340 [Chlorobium sp.]|nr:hypothetical protein [Chlorobium sp.]